MNKDTLQGEWTHLKGVVKAWWGDLTDDEVMQTNGEQEKLEGLLQQKFGETKEKAIEQINELLKTQNEFKGNMKMMKGYFTKKWGQLSGSDISQINGSLESVVGYAQKFLGVEGEKLRTAIIDAINSAEFKDFKNMFQPQESEEE